MPETLARWMVTALAGYFVLGLVLGLAFVLRGAGRLDPQAALGSRGFRLVILPAAAALWPWVTWRWVTWRWLQAGREERPE